MWNREVPKYEPDDGPLTNEQVQQIQEEANKDLPTGEIITQEQLFENIDDNETPEIKEAMRRWKEANPNDTLKHQRILLDQGKIQELPWMQLIADNQNPNEIKSGFGTRFPDNPAKGDVFVRVDQLPSTLYKFNGNIWIQVDKTLTDHYTYDTAYINHLIDKISSGELDIDLLSEGEREQITHQLQSRTN